MFWKYILINSADMSEIGELKQARDKELQIVHKRAGAASFNYPIEKDDKQPDEYAERIIPFKTGIKAKRFNWRDTIIATEVAGKPTPVWDTPWSGYVLPIDRQVSDNRMQINCVGWLNRAESRFLHDTKTYPYVDSTSTDDADIIFDLIDEMNQITSPDGFDWIPMNGSSSLSLMQVGSKLPNEGIGGATTYEPAYRGMQYDRDQQILQAIIDLETVENGCEVVVDSLTRDVNIYRKYMRDLSNIKFGYEKWPFNIQTLGSPMESEKTCNFFLARGSSLSVPRYQIDEISMAEFGPLEEIVTLADVVDNEDEDVSVLQHYASAEVYFRAFPPYTYNIVPFPYTKDNSVPEPFVDYRSGDMLRFNGKKGNVIDEKDLPIRVFGMSVKIENETGNEKLQALQVTPQQ